MSMLEKLRVYRATEQLLSSPDAEAPEHAQAIARLRQIGKPAVPRLIRVLTKTPFAETLIDLLSTLLDNTTLSYFSQALTHQDTRVVEGIVEVLRRGDRYDPNRLLELFTDPQINKAGLINILSAHKKSVKAEALLCLLNVVDKGGQGAIFQLIDQVANEAMLPQLIVYTGHEDWPVRLRIARTLSRFTNETARDALVSLLEDSHKDVRQAALEGLASIQLPVDAGPVCQLLRDPDLTVQSKAIETIIKVDDPKAVYYLLDILQEESEYVRRAAVEALTALGSTDAIKDLLNALRDQDWWVRVRAADALGNIGGSHVVEAIMPLVKDKDEFIRRSAIEILNTTQDERAFDCLIEALADQDWWVQERAVDALANLGDSRAVPPLLGLIKDDTEVTPAVIRALATLGDRQTIHPLLAKLQSQDVTVRREALRALGVLTEEADAEEVQSAIRQVMSTFDEESRELAQEMVHRLNSFVGHRAPAIAQGSASHSTLMHGEGGGVTEAPGYVTSLIESPPEEQTEHRERVSKPLDSQFVDPMELKTEDVLADRYRVVRLVGHGAFGVVILVEDMAVDEEIILKFLNPHLAVNSQIIKRFVQELRLARKITHENIIRIYDFVTIGKSYAISMEYFPSYPLAVEMKKGDVGLVDSRRLSLVRDVCSGMSVAHHETIVHRDLKPQNILVNDDGLVKVVDFGLAAAISHNDSRLTGSGALMGTPTYMAPEQVQGRDVDVRTDIYSLGVIMYEMFTGRPPYQGKDPITILYQHVQGEVVPPHEHNPNLSPELEEIILTS
ncbi:MAG: HEAT repeat domain-containing protein, partial [Candidatus Thorarchaeota archaeon]